MHVVHFTRTLAAAYDCGTNVQATYAERLWQQWCASWKHWRLALTSMIFYQWKGLSAPGWSKGSARHPGAPAGKCQYHSIFLRSSPTCCVYMAVFGTDAILVVRRIPSMLYSSTIAIPYSIMDPWTRSCSIVERWRKDLEQLTAASMEPIEFEQVKQILYI